MKKMLMITAITALANMSHAFVIVKNAKLDESQRNVLVDVVYSGGCNKHVFSLNITDRFQTNPINVEASLKEMTRDKCEMAIEDTIVISLYEHNLNKYPVGFLSLTINGDYGTNAKVMLPKYERPL